MTLRDWVTISHKKSQTITGNDLAFGTLIENTMIESALI